MQCYYRLAATNLAYRHASRERWTISVKSLLVSTVLGMISQISRVSDALGRQAPPPKRHVQRLLIYSVEICNYEGR